MTHDLAATIPIELINILVFRAVRLRLRTFADPTRVDRSFTAEIASEDGGIDIKLQQGGWEPVHAW